MAMIQCKECGQMKSSSAGRCPHCGARHDYGGFAWMAIIGAVVAIVLYIIFNG